ncbi:Acg family FMN-binding oxidoreductase [Sphingomonas azotifigens]|uniref:Acg family FMN-binding oxidoreductase n=1 Tax=Sphingomonas azotifigens TaxID=330920 RepID=UPI000A04A25E|nr:nitroreductase family protein [Sphingomonas azotifigens]
MNRRTLLIGAGSAIAGAGAGIGLAAHDIGSMEAYAAEAARQRAPLGTSPDLADLLRYATLAANSHNTQPWRFRTAPRSIHILPDLTRRTPAVDPDDHHLFVSLGCAAENLKIAAHASGRPGELVVESDGNAIRYAFRSGTPGAAALAAAISRRQSTRAVYDGRSIAPATLSRLAAASDIPGVSLILLTERARIDQVRDLVLAGNSAQIADPAFMRELRQWLRFNPRSALAARDGLFSAASGNPILPTWLGRPALDCFFTAKAENDKYARQIASSAGLAIFVGDRADKDHWIRVGRACQRFALTATSLGLKHAFLNQPVEVAGVRSELAKLLGAPDSRPDLVMRFGYGRALPYSLRRPVKAIVE